MIDGATVRRLVLSGVAVASIVPLAAAEPRKGGYLQDYVTCALWMQRSGSDAEMHATIGRWIVDTLRLTSPSRYPHLSDAVLVEAVERHCDAQPSHTLSVATFLAGTRLPD